MPRKTNRDPRSYSVFEDDVIRICNEAAERLRDIKRHCREGDPPEIIWRKLTRTADLIAGGGQ